MTGMSYLWRLILNFMKFILAYTDIHGSAMSQTQAVAIFQHRPPSAPPHNAHNGMFAMAVARAYGVSEKAVRDIWRGRTWHKETLHLAWRT